MTVEYRFRLSAPPSSLDDFECLLDRMSDLIQADVTLEQHADVAFVIVTTEDEAAHVDTALDLANQVDCYGRDLGTAVEAIDDDLVDTTEIAARANVSREAARGWSRSAVAPRFPNPAGILPGGLRVWSWSDVNAWLGSQKPERADTVVYPSTADRAEFAVRRASATAHHQPLVFQDTYSMARLLERAAQAAMCGFWTVRPFGAIKFSHADDPDVTRALAEVERKLAER